MGSDNQRKTLVNDQIKHLSDKCSNLYKGNYTESGLFTEARRKTLLELQRNKISGLPEPFKNKHDKSQFWHETRNLVKTALIDLQLFIEVSSPKDFDRTLNADTFVPIANALLATSEPATPEKAKIAQLFVEIGFQYLSSHNSGFITSHQEQEIKDAIGLCKQLTALLLPLTERDNYVKFHGMGI